MFELSNISSINLLNPFSVLESCQPFGVAMAERSWSGDYRYGFNGKEKENEIYAQSDVGNFDARFLDNRLGRWFSVDDLRKNYPSLSPYSFACNSVLSFVDPDGKEIVLSGGKWWTRKDDIPFDAGNPCPSNGTEFQKEAYQALIEFIKRDGSGEIAQLANSTEKKLSISYQKNNTLFNLDLSKRGDKRGFLSWDNRMGLYLSDVDRKNMTQTIYPDDSDAAMSPKDQLEHEIIHSCRRMISGIMLDKIDKTPLIEPENDNLEEEETMQQGEIANGKNRTNHKGIPFRADSVNGLKGELIGVENNNGKKEFFKWSVIEKSDRKKPVYSGAVKKK